MRNIDLNHRKAWAAILIAIAALVSFELALQTRAHIRTGGSVFNVLSNKSTTYQFNEKLGLKLLRASSVMEGTNSMIATNSIGLRSPELGEKQPGEIRVAFVGASTVMGTYTRHNDNTMSYGVEKYLRQQWPDANIHVINAGIAGYNLNTQERMIERLLVPLGVDFIVLYPGFIDIGVYCRPDTANNAKDYSLRKLETPSWLLTVDLISKNTVGLRTSMAGKADRVDVAELDVRPYRQKLESLFSTVQRHGIPMLAITNARSFRRDMPLDLQLELSESARYWRPCFDLQGLHDVFDSHNDLIAETAQSVGIPVYRLEEFLPGGKRYFGDSTHFSMEGTAKVVELIAPQVAQQLRKTTALD